MRFHRCGLVVALLVAVSVCANAQLFTPFATFRVIRTEHFDIIFPHQSEPSARRLASFADDVYEQLSSLLGISLPSRIPVVITPHTDLFNGFYRPMPSPSIMLFDTPMNIEWTSFSDNLKGLFIHELAHAISLNTRSDRWRRAHRVFGNWATPVFWNAPLFMVEGVAILMESLDGFGRVNDPLARQMLRQAIHEGRFLTPFQVSGIYDIPGQWGAFYEYGGLFSAWLVQTFGMEKYAELWQAMGRDSNFSFFKYRSGFYSIFRNIYRMEIMDAWDAFRRSLELDGLEENPNEALAGQGRFFAERRFSISAMAARENSIYILDGEEGRIRVYDTLTGNVRTLNTSSFAPYDLDVSADGTTLLVSGFRLTGDRHRAVVTKHRADTGWRTGRAIQGLYRARFFRDGVIGVRSDLHNTLVVFEDFSGNTEVLLRGSPQLMFSGPQAIDDEWIAVVAARSGARELLLYNYVSGEIFRVEKYANASDASAGAGGDDYAHLQYAYRDVWRYMRGLRVSEGRLLFSHNGNDRMFKLASIDLQTMQAVFSGRDFSGGVFSPVLVNGTVYYRGSFFYGDRLLRFPEAAYALSGTQTGIRLVRLDSEHYGPNPPAEPDGLQWHGPSRPYFSALHMNPFRFWLPLPLLRIDDDSDSISLDGAGLLSVMADPAGRHFITVMAYADAVYRMAMIGDFIWQNTVPGFPLTLGFSDTVVTTGTIPYRDTRMQLTGSFMRSAGRWLYGLALGGGYARFADYDGGQSAYDWAQTSDVFYYSAGFALSSVRRRHNDLFGTGFSLNTRGANIVGDFQPRVEGTFRASVETRFPLAFTVYGAYDEGGMTLHGASGNFGPPLFAAFASEEYPHPPGLDLTWLAGAEVSLGLFSFEIHRHLSHAYFNRVLGTLSVRSVLYDSQGRPDAEGIELDINGGNLRLAQSLVFRLGLVSSFVPLTFVPFSVEPNIWGAWRFSNAITGQGQLWNFGMGVNFSFF